MSNQASVVIRNSTRGTILAQQAVWARTLWARGRGLLGRRRLADGEGLIIAPCNSIHTWFMRFPIDVIFVDNNGRILKTADTVKPFRFAAVFHRHAAVIELPAGMIKRSGSRPGDQILFE